MTPEAARRPWHEVLDTAIDGFAAFQADPGFRAIWMNMQLYGVYAKADAALAREFIARTERLIEAGAPHLAPAQRTLVATMVVQTISALLFIAARERQPLGKAMVSETKVLLRRYLEPYARGRAPG